MGRLVVAHRTLLRIDELSFTARPVQHVEYVSDVFLFGVMRWFGPLGLQVLGALLAVAIASLLCKARPGKPYLAMAVSALAIATIHPWLLVRPATVSFALIAVVLAELHAESLSPRGARIFWLVPLFCVWANVHGFVLIGLMLVVGHALYTLVCRVAGGRLGELAPAAEGRRLGRAASVAALSLVAATGNQAGVGLLTAPLRASRDFGHIEEWATTTIAFLVRDAPLVGVFALLTLVAIAMRPPEGAPSKEWTSPSLFDLGLVALALVLGRSAVRMLPVAVILVAPVVIGRLGAWAPRTPSLDIALALSTWVVAPAMLFASPAARGVGFDSAHFSEGAIDYVQSARPAGHMFNSLPLGGWLDWRLFPAYQTFVDHRQGWVHIPALLAQYYASEAAPEPFAQLAEQFNFEWAFVFAAEGARYGLPIAHSPSWAMVYWDDATAIYVRAAGPNAKLARHGFRLMRHLTHPEDVLSASIPRDQTARTLALDGLLAKAQAPDSPRATFLAGCAAIAQRDRRGLDAALLGLSRLAPGHPGLAALREAWDLAERQ